MGRLSNHKSWTYSHRLIVYVVRKYIYIYIVANAKDNEWEENREERNERYRKNKSSYS